MSFVKYPKNWRANGYGWHNQEILNNLSQSANPNPATTTTNSIQQSQYPQQNNQQANYGYPPNAPAPGGNLYPSIPALPTGKNGEDVVHENLIRSLNWSELILIPTTLIKIHRRSESLLRIPVQLFTVSQSTTATRRRRRNRSWKWCSWNLSRLRWLWNSWPARTTWIVIRTIDASSTSRI